jgi:hypothetical protein
MTDIKLIVGKNETFIEQFQRIIAAKDQTYGDKLCTTTDLSSDLPNHAAWHMVVSLDSAKRRSEFRILGAIVNAILTERRETFMISSKAIWEGLAKQDKNNLPSVSGTRFNAAKKMGLGLLPDIFPEKLFDEIAKPSKDSRHRIAGTYKVVHSVLLDYIRNYESVPAFVP